MLCKLNKRNEIGGDKNYLHVDRRDGSLSQIMQRSIKTNVKSYSQIAKKIRGKIFHL